MSLFHSSHTIRAEKLTRKVVVLIQVVPVETVCQIAEREKMDVHTAGMSALLHSLAILFDRINWAQNSGLLTGTQSVALKSSVTEFYVNKGFPSSASQEQLSAFLRSIYDLQDSLPEIGDNSISQEDLRKIAASVCELADLPKGKEEIADALQEYILRVEKMFRKYRVAPKIKEP